MTRSGLWFQNDLDAAVLLVAEHLVHFGSVLEPHRVSDDEGGVDLFLLNAAKEVVGPAVDVGLTGANCQALVHELAHGNLVGKPAVDARDRDRAGGTAD